MKIGVGCREEMGRVLKMLGMLEKIEGKKTRDKVPTKSITN